MRQFRVWLRTDRNFRESYIAAQDLYLLARASPVSILKIVDRPESEESTASRRLRANMRLDLLERRFPSQFASRKSVEHTVDSKLEELARAAIDKPAPMPVLAEAKVLE